MKKHWLIHLMYLAVRSTILNLMLPAGFSLPSPRRSYFQNLGRVILNWRDSQILEVQFECTSALQLIYPNTMFYALNTYFICVARSQLTGRICSSNASPLMQPLKQVMDSASPWGSWCRKVWQLKSFCKMLSSSRDCCCVAASAIFSLSWVTSNSRASFWACRSSQLCCSSLTSSAIIFLSFFLGSSQMLSPFTLPDLSTQISCSLSSCLKSWMWMPTNSSCSLTLLMVSPLFFQSFSSTSPSLRPTIARYSLSVRCASTFTTGWLDLARQRDFLPSQKATVPSCVPRSTPLSSQHMLTGAPTILPQSREILTPLYLRRLRSASPSSTSLLPLISTVVRASMRAEQWLTYCSSP